jgi:hypothetical protein
MSALDDLLKLWQDDDGADLIISARAGIASAKKYQRMAARR